MARDVRRRTWTLTEKTRVPLWNFFFLYLNLIDSTLLNFQDFLRTYKAIALTNKTFVVIVWIAVLYSLLISFHFGHIVDSL